MDGTDIFLTFALSISNCKYANRKYSSGCHYRRNKSTLPGRYGAVAVHAAENKKEFKGHYTLVTFPLLRISGKNPEQTAGEIGAWLAEKSPVISEYNVIKGFLNLTISPSVWVELLETIDAVPDYGFTPVPEDAPLYMVEYSSPNTNKPLHLGHVRNNLLGHALSEVLKANGKRVVKPIS